MILNFETRRWTKCTYTVLYCIHGAAPDILGSIPEFCDIAFPQGSRHTLVLSCWIYWIRFCTGTIEKLPLIRIHEEVQPLARIPYRKCSHWTEAHTSDIENESHWKGRSHFFSSAKDAEFCKIAYVFAQGKWPLDRNWHSLHGNDSCSLELDVISAAKIAIG